MTSRLLVLAVPGLMLLSACEEMMAPVPAGSTTTPGAIDTNTVATTPQGIVAAQVAAPGDAGECERLALIIENAESTAPQRQAAMTERQELGCPG